jgi:cytochrome P450
MAHNPDDIRVPSGPHEPFDSAENLLLWMRENFSRYGDLFKARVMGSDVYVVSNPSFCERILRWNWRNYPRKGLVVRRIALLLGNGLIASNGEFWASQRRMIQPAFSLASIDRLTGLITQVNRELITNWKRAAGRNEAVNVTRDVSFMVLKLTLTAIFGDDYRLVEPHFKILAEETTRDFGFANVFVPLRNIIVEVAAARRRKGIDAPDFLGVMMRARKRTQGSIMSDLQLAREVMTLIVAGHETTAGLLNWLWYLVSRHEAVRTKLEAELDHVYWGDVFGLKVLQNFTYARQVIDEALRLYPPLWLMTRRAEKDDQLGEFFVPAGTEIYISPYLIQRSPHLWERPECFEPDRMATENETELPALAFCPFGAGPRNCIGELFARVEIQIHLMMVARELRLRCSKVKPTEIGTGVNLLSKDNFIMCPTVREEIVRADKRL